MENISAIKVVSIDSEMMVSFHCRLISSFHAGTTFFDNFGHSCVAKRFRMHCSCLTLHYGCIHVISSN